MLRMHGLEHKPHESRDLFVLCIAVSPALLFEHGMHSVNICGVSESPKTLQTQRRRSSQS